MSLPVIKWRVGADNYLDVTALTNTLDGTSPTDATVTVTVRDKTRTIVTGLNAQPAPYVPDTGYRLLVDDTTTPPIGLYEAEAVATKGGVTGREYAVITVEKG